MTSAWLSLLSLILGGTALILSVPIAFFFVQVLASLFATVDHRVIGNRRSSGAVAVIVPAHNESSGLRPVLADVTSQLVEADRLIVVADNCTDDTAEVGLSEGAEVITRHDPLRVGKGYALALAIDHLTANPPKFVMFIDADCRLGANSIEHLVISCERFHAPAQAAFIMRTPENSPVDHSIGQFAWFVRNWVRPLGLMALGLPVQLTGAGMMFPWEIIRSMSLASGNLVEDMKLGLDLAAAGKAPIFVPSVIVSSTFAASEKGSETQRQRWIQGHLSMMFRTAPLLLLKALVRRNRGLFFLVMDLYVPPLSLLGLLVATSVLASTGGILIGTSKTVAIIALLNLSVFVTALSITWDRYGREILPLRTLISRLPLLFSKLRLFREIILGRKVSHWIRTDRGV